MKKLLISTLSVIMLSSITFAQTTSEAYQFSNNQLYGTARYNGLSGAFGALGGDLTAVSNNPAASAVFNNSFGSVTLAQGGSSFRTNYFGTETEKKDADWFFNQIGGVMILKNNGNSSVEKIALSFNYNKTNDFDAEYLVQGNPNNTIGDFFVGQATGIPNGDLRRINNETYTDAYINIGNDTRYGAVGQQAFLGFSSFLIDATDDADDSVSTYVSNSDGSNTSQTNKIVTSGSAGKMSLNLAAAYSSGLYLGGNLNLHTLNRSKFTELEESNDYADVYYRIDETNIGAGVSADFGLIYKTKENFRLGLVYQTPAYYSISTEVDQLIDVEFKNTEEAIANGIEFNTPNGIRIDPAVIYEYELYTLRTPGKLSASAAYIFGKKGLLSFEYATRNFAKMKYGNEFSGAREINNLIEDTYQRVHTYKLGAEIRNENWRFRGGLSKSTSPYEDVNFGGDSIGYSLGTGYDWGKWRLDVAYNHMNVNTAETTFENTSYLNTANIEEKRDRVSVTLGVNF